MVKAQKTKNDVAWERLFEKYNIKEAIDKKGYFIITSAQINEFRQARLMTKFDNKKTLPKLFKDNNLAILPISATNYILGNFKLYENIPTIQTPIEFMEFPSKIESIDYNKINSETIALNCAYIARIIEDFLNEENKYIGILATVAGKMSSGKFEFRVDNNIKKDNYFISVDRSGIEIDAGYETDNSLVLVEAKNVIADDFLVRQLYYPFRLWKDKVRKKVRTIFMQYSNGIFNLYEYEFKEPTNYNSLELVKSKRYSLVNSEEMKITLNDITSINKNIILVDEPEIPFPQANSFDRIINLLELLNTDEIKTKEEITDEFRFDPRQTDYYFNAGKYLGFLEDDKIIVETNGKNIEKPALKLSDKGKQLFNVSYKHRQLAYVKAILEHKIFNKVFKDYIKLQQMPQKSEIIKYMKTSALHNVTSNETFWRRSSTVSSWINWIISLYK